MDADACALSGCTVDSKFIRIRFWGEHPVSSAFSQFPLSIRLNITGLKAENFSSALYAQLSLNITVSAKIYSALSSWNEYPLFGTEAFVLRKISRIRILNYISELFKLCFDGAIQ